MKSYLKCVLSIGTMLAAVSVSQSVARASDPTGVYAVINKVVFEPNADAPERVQIFGVFVVAVRENRNEYQPLERGYLYFTLPDSKEPAARSVARKECADLNSLAGKHVVVGFGSRAELRPTVRKADDKPASPDTYSLSYGVVRVRSDTSYAPIKSLLDAHKK